MTVITIQLRALRIDPTQRSVEEVLLEPHEIRGQVGGGRPDTLELGETHALVINGGDRDDEHPTRFRMEGMDRPLFGVALVLGLQHGNWIPATLDVQELVARIHWEQWDGVEERYEASAH